MALEHLEKTVAIDGSLHGAHYYRGLSLSALGRSADAAQALTRACEIKPGYGRAYFRLARLYERWSHISEAIVVTQIGAKMADEAKDRASLLYTLGVLLVGEGENVDAVAALSAALAVRPEDAEALAHRGTAFANLGDYKRAIRDFDEFLRVGGGDAFIRTVVMTRYARIQGRRSRTAKIPAAPKLGPTTLPATPSFFLPARVGNTLGVRRLRLEREQNFGKTIDVSGVIVWIYDCAADIAKPGLSRRAVEKILRDSPSAVAGLTSFLARARRQTRSAASASSKCLGRRGPTSANASPRRSSRTGRPCPRFESATK